MAKRKAERRFLDCVDPTKNGNDTKALKKPKLDYFPFLCLPQEIRDETYGLVLPSAHWTLVQPLIHASRQMRDEAIRVWAKRPLGARMYTLKSSSLIYYLLAKGKVFDHVQKIVLVGLKLNYYDYLPVIITKCRELEKLTLAFEICDLGRYTISDDEGWVRWKHWSIVLEHDLIRDHPIIKEIHLVYLNFSNRIIVKDLLTTMKGLKRWFDEEPVGVSRRVYVRDDIASEADGEQDVDILVRSEDPDEDGQGSNEDLHAYFNTKCTGCDICCDRSSLCSGYCCRESRRLDGNLLGHQQLYEPDTWY
ncbi:hypothetical protein EJ08DRAFT_699354 [Tothia fuscella]|uniref:F-box domain-containing protein n=1 Tax=Tothia fuscella TaxID=1048955 RepID=A0A9P4NM79_9PEZI|nr:hypothetical protein EJ08DRAFT_699354 [Tothia fuscella]